MTDKEELDISFSPFSKGNKSHSSTYVSHLTCFLHPTVSPFISLILHKGMLKNTLCNSLPSNLSTS